MFDESFLTELAERNDIVDVVGSYVRLGKKSGSNYFGLCPFHNEKTPSFSVSPDKQIYHCFGCGKGGGVINFIMEIENLSFPEAVEFLAKRAGMTVPQQEKDDVSQKRSRMYSLNKEAARFFYEQLVNDKEQRAIGYLKKRQITAAYAKSFGLGYAPDSWDALSKAMKAKGFPEGELIAADLARRGKNGGIYDTFRNRLVFPVIDVRGNVIAFSARDLGDSGPKYLNSRDTFVYKKGSHLFGLNLAKKSKAGNIILVEGNIDVVSLHQAGFDSTVATLGTALTNEQARLISRYTHEVVISYDGDAAGLKASQRAIDILGSLDVKVKVLRIPGGLDPDDYIKQNGTGAFSNLISNSESQIDYRLADIASKYDLAVPEQKVDYLKGASVLVASFPGELERKVYSMRVAQAAGVPDDVVIKEVERQRKRLLGSAKRDSTKEVMRAERSSQPPEKSLKYDDVPSAAAEEGIIRLLYLEPALASKVDLLPEDFSSEALGHIYSVLLEKIRQHAPINISVLAAELSSDEMSLLVRTTGKPERLSESAKSLADYIARIRERQERNEKPDLRELASKLKDKGKGYIQNEKQ